MRAASGPTLLDRLPPRGLSRLRVTKRLGGPAAGRLQAGALVVPCVMGPGGMTRRKREGDGATPVGLWPIRGGFFRADRGPRPATPFALRPTGPADGWCDDPSEARYNRPVRLPFRGGHETMWRGDRLYDLGLVVDYNVSRPLKGRGSAIFIHVTHPAGRPTAGCVALAPEALRRLLSRLGARCALRVG